VSAEIAERTRGRVFVYLLIIFLLFVYVVFIVVAFTPCI
jgi:hypothetical protein